MLDVGIGFGKTAEHNLQLLAAVRSFGKWDRPLLLGVSRKSFISKVSGAKTVSERIAWFAGVRVLGGRGGGGRLSARMMWRRRGKRFG